MSTLPSSPWVRSAILVVGFAATMATAQQLDPGIDVVRLSTVERHGPRVLCVVAHPDDEIAFAGSLYKIATHLDGACDLVVITNGEAGYKYSTLAERIYHLKLTDPEIGRRELPRIRRAEMIEAAKILNLRELLFLHQQDHRYTQDPNEVLAADAGVWDLQLVRATLDELLKARDYDFVFTHLPSPTAHGHHQAATVLALEAIARLSPDRRPVALGSFSTRDPGARPPVPAMLAGRPITRYHARVGPFVFDRQQKFGFRGRLDYRVITNLAMAQHRSQGTYLLGVGRGIAESFALYALHVPDAAARAQELFQRLAEPQFDDVDYDENGDRIETQAGLPRDLDPAGRDVHPHPVRDRDR